MNRSLPDEILVQYILKGNESAFSQLYERYRRQVYSAAYRILNDPEEAQDASQEIFIKVYRFLHQWNGQKSRLSTWIYRLSINHSIDCCRQRCRRAELQLSGNDAERVLYLYSLHSPVRSPFNAVVHKETVEAIRHCIARLPALQRNTFIQRFFKEQKLTEIAEIERCKLATAKTSLYRATKAVRRVLQKTRGLSLKKMESPA